MRQLIYIFVILFSCSFAFAQERENLTHDGLNRSWYIHVPNNYTAQQTYPLVIVLHGGGGTPKQILRNTRKRFNQLANRDGFIVVYPKGIRKSWNDNPNRDQNGYARRENIDDVGFISKMIAQLEESYSINSDAIFSCGISNGGLMSQTLAMEIPYKIRAIGMVASNYGKTQIEEVGNEIEPFSIMFIHGVNDPVFPYDEGEIGVFNKPRGKVLGVEKSIEFMLDVNELSQESVITSLPNNSKDGCTSKHYAYSGANTDFKVELIKVDGGGHTWPGSTEQRIISRIVGKTSQDFDACNKLWKFFKSHLN